MERSQNDHSRNVLPEDPLEGMGDLRAIDPSENTIPEDPLADLLGFDMPQEDEHPALGEVVASAEESDTPEPDELDAGLQEDDSDIPGLLLNELIDAIDQEVGSEFDRFETLDQEPLLEPAREMAQFVTFSLAGTDYAVPIQNVTEIAYLPEVTSLPNVPDWIQGVANLRGDLISLIDLRLFFGLERAPQSDSTRMLVGRTSNEDLTVGLMVDRAHGIRYLPLDEIDKPTAGIESQIAPYLSGAYDEGENLLVLLDLDRVLNSPKLRQFETQVV